MPNTSPPDPGREDCSTLEVARQLGLAVRSVQLMVDRGELEAWKTPGGHRRIVRASVERWVAQRGAASVPAVAVAVGSSATPAPEAGSCILLIEDSVHFQNLVSLLVRQHCPN